MTTLLPRSRVRAPAPKHSGTDDQRQGFVARPARKQLGRRREVPFGRLLGVALLLAFWSIGAHLGWFDPRKLSAPWTIVSTGWDLLVNGALFDNTVVSLRRAGIGIAAGVFLGTVLAVLAGLSRLGEATVDGLVQLKRSIPTLGLIPLLILWLGIGEGFKVIIITLGVLVSIYVPTHAALIGIDRRLVELSEIQDVSRVSFIRNVVLPGSLPGWFLGLRLAVTGAWLSLIVVESVNATHGLGKMMQNAQYYGQSDVIMVGLLVYAVFGLTADSLIRIAERKVLSWRQSLVD